MIKSIDIEPQWSKMAKYFCSRKEKRETLQPILNVFQGYRDLVNGKDTEFANVLKQAMQVEK